MAADTTPLLGKSIERPCPRTRDKCRWYSLEYMMKTFRNLRDKDGTLEQQEVRSPEEQGLVRRLDVFLMVFGCISQGGSYQSCRVG